MNNIFLFILTLIISGIEPFWSTFSLAIVWAAVIGVKKQDVPGAFFVFVLGLVRDVLMVNKLGQSSIILLAVWAGAAIIASKLSKNLFSAIIPALVGYSVFSLMETGKINAAGMGITLAISVLIVEIWTWRDSRESGIKVRLSS